uniref:DNA 3'-5' helicase n=1 Tax=Diabrotica virgifera virgifera TaxID=50390 RepID=A0A6P7F9E2_DIAVI
MALQTFRSVEEIPRHFRNIFSQYVQFNFVQSEVLDDIIYSDDSIVVSAPTGSGKTTIFELAIVRLLMQVENDTSGFKIIYISPIKSLCQERLVDWNNKFSRYGINCICVTGDSENVDFRNLVHHNLIISTPEKWDSLTRKWKDNESMVRIVKLFMIDEVHLLNEEDRGSTLEVIVTRMKTVQNSISINEIENCKIRFIAVSATIGNVEDIAEWIGGSKYFRFPEEIRPVHLNKIILGFNAHQNHHFKFDLSLNYRLQSLLIQYSEGKPALIFCSTRKSVEMTAKHLLQTLNIKLDFSQVEKLQQLSQPITDLKIKEMIKNGIGVHHAGMDPCTRHTVEEIFRGGDLPIMIATSTLAMGVNLPAHLVIIKSTKCYTNRGFQDYSATAIHQMIGRAGRPQFDTSATALILTTNEDKVKIEKMLSSSEPIESNLHRHLTEHLNAEVVLGTITGLDVALQWLASTFLYIRARANPRHYGLSLNYTKEQLDRKLLEMFQIDLNKLVSAGMIIMDENINVVPTMTGSLMARYYVDFETMKMFTQISGKEVFIQILAMISKCEEFADMRLRVNDKKSLNLLNKNAKKQTIRFPLNGKIKTCDMKVNCVIQAVLGNLEITDVNIQTESYQILRSAQRIIKCLIDYILMREDNCYMALLNAIIFGKCLTAKLWENSPFVSKQLTGIGSTFATQLANAGKDTFGKILESSARDLELIIKRKPPFGDYLIEEVKHLPIFMMSLEPNVDDGLQLTIELVNVDDLRQKSTIKTSSVFNLLVGNNLNEILVHKKYQLSNLINYARIVKIIGVLEPGVEFIQAHFINEDWVGVDCSCEVVVSNVTGNNLKPAPTLPKPHQPSYKQTFLDVYMKSKKPIKGKIPKKIEKINSKTLNPENKLINEISTKEIFHKSSIQENKSLKSVGSLQDKFAKQFVNAVQDTEEIYENSNDRNEEIVHVTKSKPELTLFDLFDFPEEDMTEKSVQSTNQEETVPNLYKGTEETDQNLTLFDLFEFPEEDMTEKSVQSTNQKETAPNVYKGIEETDQSLLASSTSLQKDEESLRSIFKSEEFLFSDSELREYEEFFGDNKMTKTAIDHLERSGSLPPNLSERKNDVEKETDCKDRFTGDNNLDVDNTTNGEEPKKPTVLGVNVSTPDTTIVEDKPETDDARSNKKFDVHSLTGGQSLFFSLSHKYLTDEAIEDTNTSAKSACTAKNVILRNILNPRGRKRRKNSDIHPAEELENQLMMETRAESQIRNAYFSAFRKPQKTKLAHNRSFPDSTVNNHTPRSSIVDPEDDQYAIDTEEYSDNQKNVKWKSPLVFSPGIKFSPNISLGNSSKENVENDCLNYSFDTNTTISPREPRKQPTNVQRTPKHLKRNSSKQALTNANRFPLSDKETRRSKEIDNIEKFSNICSTQLLEGTISTPGHSAHSNALDYYSQLVPLSNRRKAKQMPKKERNRSPEIENKENVESNDEMDDESTRPIKKTPQCDLNTSKVTLNSQHEDDLSDDDLDISVSRLSNKHLSHNVSDEFNPRSQEYIDSKVRNNYPFYPDDFPSRREVVVPDGYYGYDTVPYRNTYRPSRVVTQPVHCSSYVDIFGQPGKTYRGIFPARTCELLSQMSQMMPVMQSQHYVSGDHGDVYRTEVAQPPTSLPRTSEEYADSRPFPLQNITNIIPTTPSRNIYRDNEVPNDLNSSFRAHNTPYPRYQNQNIPVSYTQIHSPELPPHSDLKSSYRIQNTPYPRSHNQNIPVSCPQIHSPEYSGYYSRVEEAAPYGYAPEVHTYQNVPPVDKEYILNKYWGSFNSRE